MAAAKRKVKKVAARKSVSKKTTTKAKSKAKVKAKARKAPAKKKPVRAAKPQARAKKKAPVKTAAKAAASAPVAAYPAVGSVAPGFSAQSDQGAVVRLSDFAGKPVVLYFYPKDDTPGCTVEACDFRDQSASLRAAGAVVLGVSRDSVESHQKFRDKFALNFPLISDAEGRITDAYGVWQEKNNYGKKYMGIVRTTFLIGRDGRIAKVYPKVRVDGHVTEILGDLAAL